MAADKIEPEAVLHRVLSFLQRDRRIRVGLGLLLVAALLAVGGRSVYRLLPRHYTLTITGGDIVNNRHFLARIIQGEAPKHDLTLIVEPVSSGMDALERVSQGKLDLAFIQGGIEQQYPDVEHVATVMPELVHLLVKPGIHGMDDLKGRSVNMGVKASPSRSIALTLLRFAGYAENVDFVETNFTPEQLLGLPLRKMPDAIITVSSVPSYMVEILVRKHHYQVMEIPFPESLALRHGWAANGMILPYTYDLAPPVPDKNTQTVAVNMHLVANAKVDPQAIARLLEVMYSPSVGHRLLQPVDEARIMIPSGFPISEGVTEYLHRNDSVLTMETWHQAQGVFGLVMSFAGVLLVVVRWFKGKPIKIEYDDEKFAAAMDEVAAVEKRSLAMESTSVLDRAELRLMYLKLGQLRLDLIERYPKAVLKDPQVFDRAFATVRASQERVLGLLRVAKGPS